MICASKKKAVLLGIPHNVSKVFGQGRREQLHTRVELHPEILHEKNVTAELPRLSEIETIFATWGMSETAPDLIAQLPKLKAVFYAAGSVQGFARPFLERGILVTSAWAANAIPVQQFAMAQIILSLKHYFPYTQQCRTNAGWWACKKSVEQGRSPGVFEGARVAILGAGMIGKGVIELIKPLGVAILVFDPFFSAEQASILGVQKVSLEKAFEQADVVSNHIANLPSTVGLLTGAHFRSMRSGATFINTGRGATVRETEMAQVMRERPDLTALLDVINPEPPQDNNPLLQLPNVVLSPHIAGSLGNEVVRLADYAIASFDAWNTGKPVPYAIDLKMLESMA